MTDNPNQAAPKFIGWSRHTTRLFADENSIESGFRFVDLPKSGDELVAFALHACAVEDTDHKALLRVLRTLPHWPNERHPEPIEARVARHKLPQGGPNRVAGWGAR